MYWNKPDYGINFLKKLLNLNMENPDSYKIGGGVLLLGRHFETILSCLQKIVYFEKIILTRIQ